MKRHAITFVIVLLVAFAMAACLTPAQQNAMLRAAETMYQTGAVTMEEYFEIRDGIFAAGSTAFWQNAVQTAITAAVAWLGVRLERGPSAPPEERARRREAAIAQRRRSPARDPTSP